MNAPRTRTGLFAVTLLVFVGAVLIATRWDDATGAQDAQPGPGDRAVTMPANVASFLIHFGEKKKKAASWDGDVELSQGKIVSLELVQGGAMSSVKGAKFGVTTEPGKKKKKAALVQPILRLTVDAPPKAKVTIATNQGPITFVVDEIPVGETRPYLDGQATVEREESAVRLTATETEEDYPVMARAPDGALWLAYNVYRTGKPYVTERVIAGNFDDLVPSGNGDQIRLKRFDGATWSAGIEVTEAGLDIWRPTVAVDRSGLVHIAWAQQVNDKWNIYHRVFNPKTEKLSAKQGIDNGVGNNIHVVGAADANGRVWFAWQSWQEGRFQIALTRLQHDPDGTTSSDPPRVISTGKGNCWSPALAADSRGNVFVAYDTYDKGNYDVRLHVMGGGKEQQIAVAESARFEARPHLSVDADDRVWITYEEGDEQWGKDYATNNFRKIGLDENPGYGLYNNRTVRVKCLLEGKLHTTAGDLADAFGKEKNNKSVPRIVADERNGVWLTYRQHPKALGAGEMWVSYMTRYDGAQWSPARRLAQSENLMDNRPALARSNGGVVTVFSGDKRTKNADRKQNELYAVALQASARPPRPQPMQLMSDDPTPPPQLKPVHQDEEAQVARMRNTRFEHGGKKLGLYRGEFHRHTEFTAHRDQDGLLEDAFRYALDAAKLDWMGNGDHDNGNHDEYCWWQIQKTTDLFHNPPHFVAVQTYERSNPFPNGHRNVMMPKRGIRPLPRGNLKGTEEGGTPDTKMLYRYLKHFGGICSSHTSGTGMGTDWRDNDPVAEPVVEIYQGHRHNYEHLGAPRAATKDTNIGGYEPSGYVWNALTKGYKLGFQASSDHVSTHMSYGVVLADDFSRKGLIEAFKRRHSYGATDNIIVDFRCGKQLMGDIFETNQAPIFTVKVQGTRPIAKVSIIRSGKYVHEEQPMRPEANITWEDREPEAGKVHFYYVRVEQTDGNLAWASPMWITWKGK